MKVSVKYDGNLRDLIERRPQFSKLITAKIACSDMRRWSRNDGSSHSHDIQTIFIGKTGYGKSSTVNAFFGAEIMQTSDVKSCTRDAQSMEFKIRDGNYFSFADLPGIGESKKRDDEYIPLYANMAKKSDVIIYLLRADTRDFSIDKTVHDTLFSSAHDRKKIIYALNFCDKIEPINRELPFSPSKEQSLNIREKVNSISNLFCSKNSVIPYSASSGWNLDSLTDEILNVVLLSPDVSL